MKLSAGHAAAVCFLLVPVRALSMRKKVAETDFMGQMSFEHGNGLQRERQGDARWSDTYIADIPKDALASEFTLKSRRRTSSTVKKILYSDGSGFSYFMKMELGGQVVFVIPDTGSFDNVCFAACADYTKSIELCCSPIHCKNAVYTTEKSKHFKWRSDVYGINMKWEYGSGTVLIHPGFDCLRLTDDENGSRVIENCEASVLVGIDTSIIFVNYLNGLDHDIPFEGIFGIGIQAMSVGQTLGDLGITSFTICLNENPALNGEIIFNSHKDDSVFFTFPNEGTNFWVATSMNWGFVCLDSLTPSTTSSPDSSYSTAQEVCQQQLLLGCTPDGGYSREGCAGIIDSGTSLIMVGKRLYDLLYSMLDDSLPGGQDCDDLTYWPHLTFMLSSGATQIKITLPPHAYLAIYGKKKTKLSDKGQHEGLNLKRWPLTKADRKKHEEALAKGTEAYIDTCTWMIGLNEDETMGTLRHGHVPIPMLIIGMPLFRKYAVRVFVDGNKDDAVVSIAEANSDCTEYLLPSGTADDDGGADTQDTEAASEEKRDAAAKKDPEKKAEEAKKRNKNRFQKEIIRHYHLPVIDPDAIRASHLVSHMKRKHSQLSAAEKARGLGVFEL